MSVVRFLLRTNKVNKSGLAPLRMIIASGKDRVEITVPSVKLKPDQWDDSKQKVKGHSIINSQLEGLKLKAEGEIHKRTIEGVKIKPTEIRDFLFGKVSKTAVVAKPTAISYCEANFVKDLNLAYGTRKNYKAITKFIRAFDKDVLLEEIDKEWLTKFNAWYIKNHSTVKSTIHAKIKCLKRIVNHGLDAGIVKTNKIRGFKVVKGSSQKKYLTIEEIKLLEHHLLTNPCDAKILKPFLFCIYTGMRYGDMVSLTMKSIQKEYQGHNIVYRLSYHMGKTGNLVNVELNKKAQSLINFKVSGDNVPIFGIIEETDLLKDKDHLSKRIESTNVIMNTRLKEICLSAGLIRKFSWHESRHTFFCLGIQLGIGIETLKELGGHKSILMTSQYVQVVDNQKNKAALLYDTI